MDPITQAAIGSIAAQSKGSQLQLAKAALIGALAGMAPDLDVLLRSQSDPLWSLELHRHFTHSLFFVPFGALLCALLTYYLLHKRWGLGFKWFYTWSLLGYATHGLLDTFTGYGTQLLWPLNNHRYTFDSISIVDPLFTLPLLGCVVLAYKRQARHYVLLGITWAIAYLAIGFVQHQRAIDIAQQLAAARGHQVLHIKATPSFANLVVWRVIYGTSTTYHVDAIRPGLQHPRVWHGASIAKLNLQRDLPWLQAGSQQATDIERFRWFAMGYIAMDPTNPTAIIDLRNAILPQSLNPLWGITLQVDAPPYQHVRFEHKGRKADGALGQLMTMIFIPAVTQQTGAVKR